MLISLLLPPLVRRAYALVKACTFLEAFGCENDIGAILLPPFWRVFAL